MPSNCLFSKVWFFEKKGKIEKKPICQLSKISDIFENFFFRKRERERERDRERDRERQTETDRDRDRWRVRAKCKSVISYAYLTYLQSWMSTCQNLGGGAVRDPPKRDNIREPFNNIRLFEWYKPENLS